MHTTKVAGRKEESLEDPISYNHNPETYFSCSHNNGSQNVHSDVRKEGASLI